MGVEGGGAGFFFFKLKDFGMKHCMKNRPNNNDQVKREEECFVKTKSYSGIFMYCTNNQNFLLSKIRIRLLSTSHKSTWKGKIERLQQQQWPKRIFDFLPFFSLPIAKFLYRNDFIENYAWCRLCKKPRKPLVPLV